MGLIENFDLYWEMFATSFLASIVVGVVLPQVGGMMYLRRESFVGGCRRCSWFAAAAALPKFAAELLGPRPPAARLLARIRRWRLLP
jgi:hypothetical protein